MRSNEVIPLFPLKSVLFPKGRLPLQIFEQRYLDMISRVMKQGSGFGICLLQSGEEVIRQGGQQTVHRCGTYARIVDWDSLSNGLLGITVEGTHKFMVRDCWSQDDNLLMAQVEFVESDCIDEQSIPVDEDSDTLCGLLRQLMDHPLIDKLELTVDYDNLREVGWRLGELLPIPAERKQALLELDDPWQRAREIEEIVALMVQQS